MEKDRDDVIRALVDIQYTRNDMDFHRGTFRVRGRYVRDFPGKSTEIRRVRGGIFRGLRSTFFYKCGLIYIEEYFCGEKASLRHQPETFPGKNKFAEGPFHPGTADNQTAEQLFGC